MRFSLFTLVMLSLWIGTAMLVWQRREPWVKTHVLRHSADVRPMRFFPDNRRLLVCTRDYGCVWDIESGRELGRIAGSFSAVISPDGARIATWGADAQEVKLWDCASYALLRTLQNIEGYAANGEFSPDGKSFLLATRGGEVRRWTMDAVEPPEVYYSLVRNKNQISYSPDGKSFLAYGGESTVFVFSVESGRVRLELNEHAGSIISARFSPDGTRIITAGNDWKVCLWQASDGKLLKTVDAGYVGGPLVLAPDSSCFVTQTFNEATNWSLNTGIKIAHLKVSHALISFIGIDPTSRRVLTLCNDRNVQVWDARTGQQMLAFKFTEGYDQNYGAQSADGRNLAASSDKDVWLWRNRHPEWWWGHFYRVEVWVLAGLTLAIAVRWVMNWRARGARA